MTTRAVAAVALSCLFSQCIDVAGEVAAWSSQLPGGGGVYALADEQDRPILLASGENLRRIITFRLAPPPDASRKRADLAAITRRVYWQRTYSSFETGFAFHRFARQLVPDGYRDLCAFGTCWFLHLDPEDRLPRWLATRQLQPRGIHLGPFPTRAAVERLVETLDDLFDLCRYYHILEQAPHGEPCAYFEMGRCPAPCAGRIPLDEYRRKVSDALAFASGRWRADAECWTQQMRNAARRQEYEQAESLKQRIQRAHILASESYQLARPLDEFNYLVVQRAEGRARVKPFFVRAGWIDVGESVAAKDLPATAQNWIHAMRTPPPADRHDVSLRTEWVWLVSHFLFQGPRAPGLFLGPHQWTQPENWTPLVREHVLKAPAQESRNGHDSDPPSL